MRISDWRTLHADPRMALYMYGVRQCVRFCELNEIPLPVFMTYEEALAKDTDAAGVNMQAYRLWPFKFLQRVVSSQPNRIGAGTGLYKDGHIFVNLPVTAAPVQVPGNRRYSWPGYKVDRTAAGVVAHECGHHVESMIRTGGCIDKCFAGNNAARQSEVAKDQFREWSQLIQHSGKKKVSGYEPKPSEAFAETMRLFILNPDLLMRAIPARYYWLIEELNLAPVEKRHYSNVLDNAPYALLAQKWIAK